MAALQLCFIVLWSAVFSFCTAQIFYITTPNTLRLDLDETIFVTVEDSSPLVNILVQDYPGKIKNITQAAQQVFQGFPKPFKLRLNSINFPPTFFTTNPAADKFVILTAYSNAFRKEIKIPISYKAGYVFIQMDKPIYTPKESAQFRIISLNENGLPSKTPLQLQIRNPDGLVVHEKTFHNNSLADNRLFTKHTYKFPTFPVFGEWIATVNYGYKLRQNSTVHFQISEYVLPTFTVGLDTPDVILEKSDPLAKLRITAQYVYGKSVKGTVTFNIGVQGDTPNATYFAVVGPVNLTDEGTYTLKLKREHFNHVDIPWFPEIEGSRLIVDAFVVDEATGKSETISSSKTMFAKSPYSISFRRCLKDFKPGLPSTFEAVIEFKDGRPASGVPTKIEALADGQKLEIRNPESTSEDSGKVSFLLQPQLQHSVIQITIKTTDPNLEGAQAEASFVQRKFRSKSEMSSLSLSRISNNRLRVGDHFSRLFNSRPIDMKNIYYVVYSKGVIVEMKKLEHGEFRQMSVSFTVTHNMVPSFRLIIFAHHNNELLADSLNIEVEDSCHPKALVDVKTDFGNTIRPGDEGKIKMKGTSSTLVGLLGVDSAVYAIHPYLRKDLLTRNKIFRTFAKHDLGCGPGGGETTEEILANAGIIIASNIHSPAVQTATSCSALKRRKREIANDQLQNYKGLDRQCCALGMSHDKLNRDCDARHRIVLHYFNGRHQNCSRAFLQCCKDAKDKGFTEMMLAKTHLGRSGYSKEEEANFLPIEEELDMEKKAQVRTDFREMWFTVDVEIGANGEKSYDVSLPHSITTWEIQAVSVHRDYGICVAEPQKVVSFKDIFLQLDLPYSVVRNEQIEIRATVYNYGKDKLYATVYMYGVEELCSGTVKGERSERKRIAVEKHSGKTVTFPIIPLKTGSFDIKVVALSQVGSDVIQKKLNVVPEGFPDKQDIPIQLDPSNIRRRSKRALHQDSLNYLDMIDPIKKTQTIRVTLDIPRNVVPGTETCTISTVGNQVGPAMITAIENPENLLHLPRGCGEQNMVYLAPTMYAMKYMKVNGRITPEIEEKGYGYMREGYANELSYRKLDGSYSAFKDRPPSTWLTAFVTKVFCQASELIYIDETVICGGVKWLVDNQQADGSLAEINPMIHLDMMGGVQSKIPMTAFALVALEECQCEFKDLLRSKRQALSYLEEHLGDVEDPLAVAIVAYALKLGDSRLKIAAKDKLMSMATRDEDKNTMHWGSGKDAKDIEISSYALLTLLQYNEMPAASSIVNWLNSKQLQSGAFQSTQDTVIALQALSEYAIKAQLPPINLVTHVTLSTDKLFNKTIKFSPQDAHLLQDVEVDKVGGAIFINSQGNGIGSMNIKLRYNLLDPPEDICKFEVKVNATEVKEEDIDLDRSLRRPGKGNAFHLLENDEIRGVKEALGQREDDTPELVDDPRRRGPQIIPRRLANARVKRQNDMKKSKFVQKISICARYLGRHLPEMSIIDVGIFTGFEPNIEDLEQWKNEVGPDAFIDRYDLSSRGVIFYLRTVPNKEPFCFYFHAVRKYFVSNMQSSAVKVYDYYHPRESCTVFYNPSSNSPMLRTRCDEYEGVCKCAEDGCPLQNPFEKVRRDSRENLRSDLMEMACSKSDYVWLGSLAGETTRRSGYYNITFRVEKVIKAGIQSADEIEDETVTLLAQDHCPTVDLSRNAQFLIMGKDGGKHTTDDGYTWYDYLLDKTSVVHLWTETKKLQRRFEGDSARTEVHEENLRSQWLPGLRSPL